MGASSATSATYGGKGLEEPAGMITTTEGATTTCGKRSVEPACRNDSSILEIPNLAALVALFCRRGLHPGAPCCDPVISYVDLAGICRVTREPPLILARINASLLLELYASCGRQRTIVTAACQGASPLGVIVKLPPSGSKLSARGDTTTCDAGPLARDLTEHCNIDNTVPTRSCCRAVLMTVDVDQGCLCNVIGDGWFALSRLDISFMWHTYTQCGGKKQMVPKDITSCDHAPSPPPSSSPPPPPEERQHHGLLALEIAGIVLGTILVILAIVAAAVALYRKLKRAEVVPVPPPAPGIPLANLPQEPAAPEAIIIPGQEPPAENEQVHAPSSPSVPGALVPPSVRPPPTGPPSPLPRVIKPPPAPLVPPVPVTGI
ncbi:hypothetical protein QOZ80_3BG0265860 [Eleusine coracana subsp. coracana]|nr:hypothetical protein QOZ80_3BG0265860 [Eleusine coracana subsp. coracana]